VAFPYVAKQKLQGNEPECLEQAHLVLHIEIILSCQTVIPLVGTVTKQAFFLV